MIRKILNNLRTSKNFKGSLSEKISVFTALTRLQVKSNRPKKRNTQVSERIFNYQVFSNDHFTIDFLFKEIFIANEYFFQPSTKEPLIIDCGANIGMSVLYFKKLFPGSKIIAFEPNPHAFTFLIKNIETNNISNVEAHNIALFERQAEIPFFFDQSIGALVGSVKKGRAGDSELKVQAQKLSHYLKNIERVDLIKMDVEGAEINIVDDLIESSSLNKAKEYLIEYHHNMNGEPSLLSPFLNKFESNGFNYNIKAASSKKGSFQNILIHFYKM